MLGTYPDSFVTMGTNALTGEKVHTATAADSIVAMGVNAMTACVRGSNLTILHPNPPVCSGEVYE